MLLSTAGRSGGDGGLQLELVLCCRELVPLVLRLRKASAELVQLFHGKLHLCIVQTQLPGAAMLVVPCIAYFLLSRQSHWGGVLCVVSSNIVYKHR